jgi:hypothetical protein
MGDGVVAGQLHHVFVAREHSVGRQRKGLVGRFRPQPREHVRHGAAFMVAALGADMVEGRAIGHVDLHALVEPRGGGAVFQHRDLRPRLHPHQVVQDRVRGLVAVQVDQADRLRGLARGADHDPVGGEPGVERRQRAVPRGPVHASPARRKGRGPSGCPSSGHRKAVRFPRLPARGRRIAPDRTPRRRRPPSAGRSRRKAALRRWVEQRRPGAVACVRDAGSVYFQYSSRRVGSPSARTRATRHCARRWPMRPPPRGATDRARRASVRSSFAWASAITPPPRGCRHSRSSRPPAPARGRPSSRCARRT